MLPLNFCVKTIQNRNVFRHAFLFTKKKYFFRRRENFFLVVKNRVLGRKKFILKYFVCPQKVTKFSSKNFETAFFFYEKFVLFTLNYFALFKIILFTHEWFKNIMIETNFS